MGFHVHMNVALLKRLLRRDYQPHFGKFPRSYERGSIEASIGVRFNRNK